MSTDTPSNEETPEEVPAAETPVSEPEAVEPAPVEEPATSEPAVEEPSVEAPEVPSSDLPELSIGSGGASDSEVDPDFVPVVRGKIDRFGVAMGTGRRKTSVARVRISEGSGSFTVNGRSLDDFFAVERDRNMVMAPLKLVGKEGAVDVSVRVSGGGTTGQTGAIVLGIGRALQGMNPEFHHALSDAGFLTRDGRMVERKKYGLRKARRSYQFSKR